MRRPPWPGVHAGTSSVQRAPRLQAGRSTGFTSPWPLPPEPILARILQIFYMRYQLRLTPEKPRMLGFDNPFR